MSAQVKRIYYFGAGIALGVAATRRTRRAKEAAREALKAKVTPSAIAADVADAIAELGNAVGYFAADVRQGVLNRRASYRPMIDNATGAVVLVGPEGAGPGGPNQVGPNQVGPNQVGPNQAGANHVGANRVVPNQMGDQAGGLTQRRAPGAQPPRGPARRSA